jgi:hypothetical protein
VIDVSSLYSGLTFYRQQRMDGGIRSGIMVGENTLLGRFEEGQGEYDPSLVWSVDLRCSGEGLPQTAEEARRWLLDHQSVIRDGFSRYADYLRAGSDVTGPYLLEWADFPDSPPGVAMKIVCGAMRRVDARLLASVLEDLGQRWDEIIQSLTAGQTAFA